MLHGYSRATLATAIALASMCVTSEAATKYHEHVFYAFQGGTDGEEPDGSLIADSAGNLYGTTVGGGGYTGCISGGPFDCGTVFKLAPDGTETVLYRFCSQNNCADGAYPVAGLMMDKMGNLYGTTSSGGANGSWGTIFEINAKGREKVLYSFRDSIDGATPYAGLIRDQEGNFYGTARGGGEFGAGTIFTIAPSGVESTLYSFCSQQNCADGAAPWGGLTSDKSGDFYGTTEGGGASETCTFSGGCGVVFELPKGGSYKVLHSFGAGSDGANPFQMNLFLDRSGNLFGTTGHGNGTGCGTDEGCGTAFEIMADGNESVIHGFGGARDGRTPDAGLIMDRHGNLYGTTVDGNSNDCAPFNDGCGTVFRLSPDGTEKILFAFRMGNGGAWPQSPLIRDNKGNLYGTTTQGGSNTCGQPVVGCGVVFEISP